MQLPFECSRPDHATDRSLSKNSFHIQCVFEQGCAAVQYKIDILDTCLPSPSSVCGFEDGQLCEAAQPDHELIGESAVEMRAYGFIALGIECRDQNRCAT